MKIYEIIIAKSSEDSDLCSKVRKDIDMLHTRMDVYSFKIGRMPDGNARDFLKKKLQNDFHALTKLIHQESKLAEAIHKLPLTPKDFDLLKQLMDKPIPAIVATMYVMDIIDDDELNDQFSSLEDTQPDRDIRPLIADWIKRVMPDQMYHFDQEAAQHEHERNGMLSPIHGNDPHMYSGGSHTGTQSSGNAYGSF